MLYFFNLIAESEEITDPEGAELATDEAAQSEAWAIAAELLSEFPDRFQVASVLEVVTQEGWRILALPVKRLPTELAHRV